MFCSSCGSEIGEKLEFCQNCGAKKGETMNVSGVSNSTSLESNTMVTDSISAIKQTFTVNPEHALETAINSTGNTWVILGGLYVVLSALSMRVIFGNFISSILGMFGIVGGAAGLLMREQISQLQNQMLVSGLVGGAITLLAISACVKLLYSMFKIDFSFVKVMDVVAASSLVASVALSVSIVVSFFSIIGAFTLLYVGSVVHAVMLYRGIQKSAKFPCSPFWVYIALMIAVNFVLVAFTMNFLMPDMSSFMPDATGMFDMFGF
ncbi:MAG: hypothetical protein FWB96_05160 [Defluviitaleaceae bacterium]|nr:hypothetical protein [Defluviitaleaceae bacterium]MCL2262177.1 hypothetical protein [Defluviitaleaceae bacterium]